MFVRKILPIGSVIALAVFLAASFSFSRAAVGDAYIGGTAWNQSTGWIFQNPTKLLGRGYDPKVHGVKKDTQGNVTGWSWSDVYGWICWGETCNDPALDRTLYGDQQTPTGDIPFAKVETDESLCDTGMETIKIITGGTKTVPRKMCPTSGWIKILSLKGDGWIRLAHVNPPSGKAYGLKYDEVRREFRGWAWSGTVGWISFSGKTLYETRRAPPCPRGTRICKGETLDSVPANKKYYEACKAKCGTDDQNIREDDMGCQGQPGRQGCMSGLVCAGDRNSRIEADQEMCRESTSDTSAPAIGSTFTSGRACDPYCDKSVDLQKDDPSSLWKTAFLGTRILARGGNIYGKTITDAGSDYRKEEKNATREFSMLESKTDGSGNVVRLKSNLGSLDILALTTRDSTSLPGLPKKNKYRQTVVNQYDYVNPAAPRNPEASLFDFLRNEKSGGQVFFHDGDLAIGDTFNPQQADITWTVSNGFFGNDGKAASGARTIVIHGNLTIKAPILYEKVNKPNLTKQLASLAWVVYKNPNSAQGGGNVTIDPCIPPSLNANEAEYFTEVSGIFIAENTISLGDGKGETCKPGFAQAFRDVKENARLAKSDGRLAWTQSSQCDRMWGAACRARAGGDAAKERQCDSVKQKCVGAVAKNADARAITEGGTDSAGNTVDVADSADKMRETYDAANAAFLSGTCWVNDPGNQGNKIFLGTPQCNAEKEALTRQRAVVEAKEKEANKKQDDANDAITSYLSYCMLDENNKTICEQSKNKILKAVRLESSAYRHQELSSQFGEDIPLRVNGALFARKISFQRIYAGVTGGSEIIHNDGRLLVNTPPGLEDFTRSLPSR